MRCAAEPISVQAPLVLGSASPRRRELIATLRLPFRVHVGTAMETLLPGEAPTAYLERVVAEKLASVSAKLEDEPFSGVLVADTIVIVDDDVLGKPEDRREAVRLVQRLVGRTHWVATRYALALARDPSRAVVARTVQTEVAMRVASSEEVERYAATGEGLDKAGGYAVQGLGAFLVSRINGSYTNVVGLPLCEVVMDLQDIGLLRGFP